MFKFITIFNNTTIKIIGIYFIWVCLHYFASHIYSEICVPATLYGFFISPFLTLTPHCQALRWLIYNSASFINNAWFLIGTWLCSLLIKINEGINIPITTTEE